MKLSFSLPSRSVSSKSNLLRTSDNFDGGIPSRHEDAAAKEFVSEFDASRSLADIGKPRIPVVPPKENEWRPLKKMKNLHLPFSESVGTDMRFEQESSVAEGGHDSKISYGLNLRQSTDSAASPSTAIDVEDESESRVGQPRPASAEFVLLQKLKDDLKRLPDDRGFEEFEKISVEAFGTAVLAGYGWHEGRGIGKNAKEDTKVVQCVKRTDKQGLGFVDDSIPSTHKKERENERGGKRVDEEKGSERDRDRGRDVFAVGKQVRVIAGKDAGHRGTILKKVDPDYFVLKLLSRGKQVEVKVRVKDVAELGSQKEESFLKKFKEGKIQSGDKEENNGRREEGQKSSQVSWLMNHIRVRIISKDLRGGKFYRKKGEIVDVAGSTICDISMDESRELIQGVSQNVLETALPKRGGPVVVLYGKHKGVYGTLVERDTDQETGVVRDADSHALLTMRLDQIAEYVGDPSYLGY